MPQPPGSPACPALPPVIGHRGAAGSAPENTLAGFRRAAALGLSWIECDLRLSADGAPVLLHDASLERTTNGRGLLAQRCARELAALDAGSWFDARCAGEPLPTLAAALACWRELGLAANLELKTEDGSAEALVGAVADVLAAAQFPRPLLISSFEPEALAAARARLPALPRALLVETVSESALARARSFDCCSIHAAAESLLPQQVAAARARGFAVLAYTVNEPAAAQRLWAQGVAAVFSDFPERLTILPGSAPPPALAPPD